MKMITMEARIENIEPITAFVGHELEAINCPPQPQMQIIVAIDELISNIANYAYAPGGGTVTVEFDYDEADRTIMITFTDEGVPYDPLQHEEPDISLPAEKREIGGLGIHLVRKTMDDMKYRYENSKNILTIFKRI